MYDFKYIFIRIVLCYSVYCREPQTVYADRESSFILLGFLKQRAVQPPYHHAGGYQKRKSRHTRSQEKDGEALYQVWGEARSTYREEV